MHVTLADDGLVLADKHPNPCWLGHATKLRGPASGQWSARPYFPTGDRPTLSSTLCRCQRFLDAVGLAPAGMGGYPWARRRGSRAQM